MRTAGISNTLCADCRKVVVVFGLVHCRVCSWGVGHVPGCPSVLAHARTRSTNVALVVQYLASMPGEDDFQHQVQWSNRRYMHMLLCLTQSGTASGT